MGMNVKCELSTVNVRIGLKYRPKRLGIYDRRFATKFHRHLPSESEGSAQHSTARQLVA
jgi:hypothetical protein